MSNLKFAFFGTPEVACQTLEILKVSGYLPALIVTSPDAPAGRGLKMQASPVAEFAAENNIPCLKPEALTPSLFGGFDLFLVVAYGKIIPEPVLNIPKYGSINVHYSLLPKYRGASPVESAILNGETETGVTIQRMVYKLDAGPIIAAAKTTILPSETAPELRERLIKLGGELLIQTLPKIENEVVEEIPQDESKATHSKKISKEDGLIDLNDDPKKNYNKFRAYALWPRTYFFKDGKRYIITSAELTDGKFVVKKVIPEGKKEQPFPLHLV